MPLETTYQVRTNWNSPASFRSGMPTMSAVPIMSTMESPDVADADDEREDLPFENDSLGRREMALNARIARFEEIVRQTKLEMAERQSQIERRNRQIEEREARLDEQEQRLQILSEELNAREEALSQRAVPLTSGAELLIHSRERAESADPPHEWEDFQSRTNDVLEKIRRGKRELEALLAQIH